MTFQRFSLLSLIIFSIISPACKKAMNDAIAKKTITAPTGTGGYVLTPGGPRLAANVHLIEKGFHIAVQNGHVLKIETATGKVVEDFGLRDAKPDDKITTETHDRSANNTVEPVMSGWMAFTQWLNTGNQQINSFSTSMTVPAAPTENDGQIFYIFEGLQNTVYTSATDLIQVVLQYGYNNSFGGDFWTIDNWYIWSSGAVYGTPQTQIPVNTVLQGAITYQPGTAYSYTSTFTNYPNSELLIVQGEVYQNEQLPAIPEQYEAVETLEAYKSLDNPELLYQEDYPPVPYISMNDIQLLTGGAPAPLTWTEEVGPDETFGEHSVIISNNSAGSGDVELFFKYIAPGVTGTTQLYEGIPTSSGTITAYPGQTVNVEVYTFAKDQGLTQTVTFRFTTSGVDFISGGNNISATNSSATAAFIMPSSGTVNWSATYSQIGGSSHPYDGADIHVY
jgi:hypothetical protein